VQACFASRRATSGLLRRAKNSSAGSHDRMMPTRRPIRSESRAKRTQHKRFARGKPDPSPVVPSLGRRRDGAHRAGAAQRPGFLRGVRQPGRLAPPHLTATAGPSPAPEAVIQLDHAQKIRCIRRSRESGNPGFQSVAPGSPRSRGATSWGILDWITASPAGRGRGPRDFIATFPSDAA
jgi:hypothetical protein